MSFSYLHLWPWVITCLDQTIIAEHRHEKLEQNYLYQYQKLPLLLQLKISLCGPHLIGL
jgi:hypothetical protein